MKKLILTTVLAILCIGVSAQTKKTAKGSVTITGDVKVSQLVEKHIEFNETIKTIPGYRVQLASLSGADAKSRAFSMKEQLKTEFPEVESYVIFTDPNFRVKIGDFRTKLEAHAFLQKTKELFPGGTIVKDNINPNAVAPSTLAPETDEDATK